MSKKVNCLKCNCEIDKKPGLWVCDPCMESSPAMMINTVSFNKEPSKELQEAVEKAVVDDALKDSPFEEYNNNQDTEDLFKERFLANRGMDKDGKPIETEMVDHPDHYNMGSIEVIDAIEDWDLDFRLGNAVKYIARAGRKNEDVQQDLEKALWYIKRYIDKEC
jgi:hypothetical protein